MLYQKYILPLYLLTLFLIGLGCMAILPPFEGFDEIAHYSSMRQIADAHTIPVYGSSFLDIEVDENYQGPGPYGSGSPPFDLGPVYPKFFASPDLISHYISAYRQPHVSIYQPGQEMNWQAQHPPLYYIVMAPFEKVAESFSLVTRLLVLRLISFLIALAGIGLGFMAFQSSGGPVRSNPAIVGFMLYPIMLPMFFPEFARLGNDALCVFLIGLAALLFSKWSLGRGDKKLAMALGVVLGVGLLTKAFFIAVLGAVAMFMLVRVLRRDQSSQARGQEWMGLALILVPALLIGGGWYIYKLVAYGTLIGSIDAIQLAKQGGLTANLKQNFSVYALIRGLAGTFASYIWAGTRSLVRMPSLLQLPLLVLVVATFAAMIFQLRRKPVTDWLWLSVWLLVMFGAGLFQHELIGIALNGNGQTPGWYVHVLLPWVAPALGVGICSLLQRACFRPYVIGLLLYAVLFQIMALWAQFALFMGCAAKGDDKTYVFSGHAFCFDQMPVLINHLAIIGWPALAVVGFGGGAISAVMLLRIWMLQPKAH